MAPYGNLSILRDQTDGKAGLSELGRASGQPPPWSHIYARIHKTISIKICSLDLYFPYQIFRPSYGPGKACLHGTCDTRREFPLLMTFLQSGMFSCSNILSETAPIILEEFRPKYLAKYYLQEFHRRLL